MMHPSMVVILMYDVIVPLSAPLILPDSCKDHPSAINHVNRLMSTTSCQLHQAVGSTWIRPRKHGTALALDYLATRPYKRPLRRLHVKS